MMKCVARENAECLSDRVPRILYDSVLRRSVVYMGDCSGRSYHRTAVCRTVPYRYITPGDASPINHLSDLRSPTTTTTTTPFDGPQRSGTALEIQRSRVGRTLDAVAVNILELWPMIYRHWLSHNSVSTSSVAH